MRNHCIVCKAPLGKKPLYICKNIPSVSQNLPTADTLSKDQPLHANLRQCTGCGLVQFDCEPVSYYKASTRTESQTKVILYEKFLLQALKKYHLINKRIIEFGCGTGECLSMLKQWGCSHTYGVEYDKKLAKNGKKNGFHIQQKDVEQKSLKIEGAPFDAFFSMAYLARLIHPNSFFQNIYNNTTPNTIGVIAVPSFEHLIQPEGFFDLAIDHIAYYNVHSLQFLLQKNGFQMIKHGFVGNLYLYAIVQKRQPYDLQSAWADVEPLKKQFQDCVAENTKNQKKIAVWCAGHFAFVTLAVTDTGNKISYIIDKAPFKQNRYAPLSHVPIVSPEHYAKEPVDMIVILAPLYIDEIVQEIRSLCGSQIKIAAMDYGKGIYRIS